MNELIRISTWVGRFGVRILVNLIRWIIVIFRRHFVRIFGALGTPLELWSRPRDWGERAILWAGGYVLCSSVIVASLLGAWGGALATAWAIPHLLRLAVLWLRLRPLPIGSVWSSSFGRHASWIVTPSRKLGIFVVEPLLGYVVAGVISLALPEPYGGVFWGLYFIAFVGATAHSLIDFWVHHAEAINATDAMHQAGRIERSISGSDFVPPVHSGERTPEASKQRHTVTQKMLPVPRINALSPELESARAAARLRLRKEKS